MSAGDAGHMMEGMTGGTSLEHLPFGLDAPVLHALEGLAICIDLMGVALILFGFFVALSRLLGGLRHGIGLTGNLGNLIGTPFLLFVLEGYGAQMLLLTVAAIYLTGLVSLTVLARRMRTDDVA